MNDFDNNSFDMEQARLEAIQNLGGLESLYNKYLAKFRSGYSATADEISAAIQSNNLGEAHRLAHSVKGLAATLGLLPLAEASLKLEELLHQAIDTGFTEDILLRITPALDSFRNELIRFCK